MAKKKISPRGARIFGIGFATFACIFIVIGGGTAWSQASKLNSWLPIEAQIIGGEVTSRRGNKGGRTYIPVVRFAYRVDGVERNADTPLPIDMSIKDSSWAHDVVRRFPAGSRATAYYNPRAPDEAFLLREVSVSPYLFMLFPMIHVCVGLGVWWFAGGQILDARSKARRMGWMTMLWNGVGVLAFVHYLAIGGRLDWTAGLAFGIYAALGTGFGLAWVRFLRKAAAVIKDT